MAKAKRRGLVAGAAVGATALFAPSAHAANFVVTSLADGPADACDTDCKLRDAIVDASANSEPDAITFADGLTGTIRLTAGELLLSSSAGLTIDGPGAGVITISGDANDNNTPDGGDVRIFEVAGADKVVEGLTLTEGVGSPNGTDFGSGGAILNNSGELTLVDSVVTGNRAGLTGQFNGGAISSSGSLTLLRTDVTANRGGSGGGLAIANNVAASITGGRIADNVATNGTGGGIDTQGQLAVTGSTISGNTSSASDGGGISASGKYSQLQVADSVISGNSARDGAGIRLGTGGPKYASDSEIARTTISGNPASRNGGGLSVSGQNEGDSLAITRSTISGNDSAGFGGGVHLAPVQSGEVRFVNSTISDNDADSGGGISFGDAANSPTTGSQDGVALDNSTVAANRAATQGGGLFLSAYDSGEPAVSTSATIPLTSTIVADNTAAGNAQDLDREDGSQTGGFDLAYSLVEAPGDAPLFQSEGASNITGADPQLGALGNNGGPTATHLPAQTSRVVDRGDAPGRLTVDQRGSARTIDAQPPNAPGGDGTDIGAVETARPADAATTDTGGTTTGGTNTTTTTPFTRVRPLRVTQRLTPKRDRRAPFRFRVTGRVVQPAPLTRGEACGTSVGIVSVQVKYRGRTISNRRVRIRAGCTYSSTVSFRDRRRFPRARSLKFTVRWLGNKYLEPVTNRSLTARVR